MGHVDHLGAGIYGPLVYEFVTFICLSETFHGFGWRWLQTPLHIGTVLSNDINRWTARINDLAPRKIASSCLDLDPSNGTSIDELYHNLNNEELDYEHIAKCQKALSGPSSRKTKTEDCFQFLFERIRYTLSWPFGTT